MHNKVTKVGNRRWSPDDDALLKEMLFDGCSYAEIAAEMGVTIASVESRRSAIGLPSPSQIKKGLV